MHAHTHGHTLTWCIEHDKNRALLGDKGVKVVVGQKGDVLLPCDVRPIIFWLGLGRGRGWGGGGAKGVSHEVDKVILLQKEDV